MKMIINENNGIPRCLGYDRVSTVEQRDNGLSLDVQKTKILEKVYDFELMMESGHLTGYKIDDEATINVYLSREDIANLSNMTTSNAIRTLSTFASEGVISIDGRKIKILDKVRLDRVSKLG